MGVPTLKKFVYLPPRQQQTHWTAGLAELRQQAISIATRMLRYSRQACLAFLRGGRGCRLVNTWTTNTYINLHQSELRQFVGEALFLSHCHSVTGFLWHPKPRNPLILLGFLTIGGVTACHSEKCRHSLSLFPFSFFLFYIFYFLSLQVSLTIGTHY